jgi:FkbM family methyltransferase
MLRLMGRAIEHLAERFRGFRRHRKGLPRQGVQVTRAGTLMGSDYGGYVVCPDGLDADSVVYSFGIGEDASLDLALIERYGLTVHAFDPTPRSIAWVEGQDMPETFEIHPWGLAAYDGTARFTPPENPEHISHTLLDRSRHAGEVIEVEVYRLRTIMKRLGHSHIDVLKMDVEGAEYEALDDILDCGAPFTQLLIEFHHQLEGVPLARTEETIDRLNGAGFSIFAIREGGHEMSFVLDR